MDFGFIIHIIVKNSKTIFRVISRLHKSKLQISVEILCCLSSKGSLKLKQISNKIELNKSILIEHLGFLYERGLIGENLGEEKTYFITERGLSLINVMGPMVREAQRLEIRNLERISSAIAGTKFKVKKVEEKKPRWKRLQKFIKIDLTKSDE